MSTGQWSLLIINMIKTDLRPADGEQRNMVRLGTTLTSGCRLGRVSLVVS